MCLACKISPGVRSDHSYVSMQFVVNAPQRGRGFWKFDKSLLESKDFKNYIIKTIETSASDNKEAEHTLLWETIKSSVRGACVSYASKVRKEVRCEIEAIEIEIKDVEKSLLSGSSDSIIGSELRNNLENQLQLLQVKLSEHVENKGKWAMQKIVTLCMNLMINPQFFFLTWKNPKPKIRQ